MAKKSSSSPRRRSDQISDSHCAHIGERIKAAADAVGSRKEAARLAGVSDDMLYRYMRGETPPRFDAVVGLALAAGFSLDWMATGEEAAGVRENAAAYDAEQARWAKQRIEEIEARLEAEPAHPVAAERIQSEAELSAALEDLRRIARLAAVPQELRRAAALVGSAAFGEPEVTCVPEPDTPSFALRLAEIADELEDAIREVGYRPPDLLLDGLKTAMYVNEMPRAAAVTMLQFIEAYERRRHF